MYTENNKSLHYYGSEFQTNPKHLQGVSPWMGLSIDVLIHIKICQIVSVVYDWDGFPSFLNDSHFYRTICIYCMLKFYVKRKGQFVNHTCFELTVSKIFGTTLILFAN